MDMILAIISQTKKQNQKNNITKLNKHFKLTVCYIIAKKTKNILKPVYEECRHLGCYAVLLPLSL
jgi:hypothetical protein